ncbi:MAG: ATP-binding protein [bacterium]
MSRLTLRLSLGILFVLVASFFIVRWATIKATRERVHEHFSSHMNILALARERLDTAPADQLDRELQSLQRRSKHRIRLLDPARDVLPDEVRRAWKKNEPRVVFQRGHGATVYLPIRKGTRILAVGRRAQRWRDHALLIPVLLALFVVILGTGFVLAAPLVRRLRRLERTTVKISEGDLEARTSDSSRDAIGRLAQRFNVMADRVQALLESQQQLMQAVSHELRTPAARIRFGLEMLRQAGDEAERERRIESIDEDLVELDHLVEELLLYIRSGEQSLELNREVFAGDAELREQLERLGELRPEIERSVRLGQDFDGQVSADRRYFQRALRNLLGNALRHATHRVDVELTQEGDCVLVAVTDDGPGVPEGDRRRLFEPFFRVDASRNRESGGAGLGLAIVKRIVEAHGGTVSIDPAAADGARFVTSWPTSDPGARPDTNGYKPVPKTD